jgi:hypothetical protein
VASDVYLEGVELVLRQRVFARLGLQMPAKLMQAVLDMCNRRRLLARAEESILAADLSCKSHHHT